MLFDIYRLIAKQCKLKKLGIMLGDIVFWLLFTPLAFLFLLWGNWGEVRLYVLIGLIAGVILYLHCLSRFAVPMINYLLLIIKKVFLLAANTAAVLLAAVCWPFRLMFFAVSMPLKLAAKLCKKLLLPVKKLIKLLSAKLSTIFRRKKIE